MPHILFSLMWLDPWEYFPVLVPEHGEVRTCAQAACDQGRMSRCGLRMAFSPRFLRMCLFYSRFNSLFLCVAVSSRVIRSSAGSVVTEAVSELCRPLSSELAPPLRDVPLGPRPAAASPPKEASTHCSRLIVFECRQDCRPEEIKQEAEPG